MIYDQIQEAFHRIYNLVQLIVVTIMWIIINHVIINRVVAVWLQPMMDIIFHHVIIIT